MEIFIETVEVAKWIPILALVYILFLQGLLLYIVYLRHREHSQMIVKPDAGDTPQDYKNNNNPIEQRSRGKNA